MAWVDRNREPDSGGKNFASITPVVKWLLIVNAAIYIIDLYLKGDAFDGPLRLGGMFTIQSAFFEGRIWEFITFQFLHAHLGHLLLNSIGLFVFGPWMERWWGAVKFLCFYLLSGVGGALFFSLLVSVKFFPGGNSQGIIGASAGIYGMLVGVAVIAPSLVVTLLFPPISLTMRQLALAALAISVAIILFGIGSNEGGEAGHLGGAIAGFLLIRGWMLWGNSERASKKVTRGPRIDIAPKIKPRTLVDLSGQSEIDAILDKISKDGFQSISDEERELLQRAAEHQKKRQ